MTPNLIPTARAIEAQAAQLFPIDKSLQSSFILGVWRTIYTLKINKDESK